MNLEQQYLDHFNQKGFTLVFSSPCQVQTWGQWMVQFEKEGGRKGKVSGYGTNETEALTDAIKNLAYLEQVYK
jgi:hypothetical protein